MTLPAAWLWSMSGWVLLALGIMVTVWAIFGDRARGRRRCPRCWYDMRGVPGLVCPECGREARSERKLHRRRRRWRWAALGLALLAMGWGVRPVSRWIIGWPEQAPTIILIALLPWLETESMGQVARWVPVPPPPPPRTLSGHGELWRRTARGLLSQREAVFLIWRCERGDKERRAGTDGWVEHYLELLGPLLTSSLPVSLYWIVEDPPSAHTMRRAREAVARTVLEVIPARKPGEFIIRAPALPRWLNLQMAFAAEDDDSNEVEWHWIPSRQPSWSRSWDDGVVQTAALPRLSRDGVPVLVRQLEMQQDSKSDRYWSSVEGWRVQMNLPRPTLRARTSLRSDELDAAIRDTLNPAFSLARYYLEQPLLWLAIDDVEGSSARSVGWVLGANPHLALAVHLEVLFEGELVAEGEAWWAAGHLSPSQVSLQPVCPETWSRDARGTPLLTQQVLTGRWVLRITGDPLVAQRAHVLHYWEGSLELPLEPPREPHRPRNRSQPPRPRRRTGAPRAAGQPRPAPFFPR
jgi:hypothetical protein